MTKDPETGQRTVVPSQDIAEYKRVNFTTPVSDKNKKLAEERGFPEDYFRTTGGRRQSQWGNPADKVGDISDEPLGGYRDSQYYRGQRGTSKIIPDVGMHEETVSRFDGPDWLVGDPARTAKWAGRAALPAAVVGGLGALEYFTQGEKPMTDYAMPVQPDRGGYNPNVRSCSSFCLLSKSDIR